MVPDPERERPADDEAAPESDVAPPTTEELFPPTEPVEVIPLGSLAALSRRILLIGVLPLFSIVYLILARNIELPNRVLPVDPRAFPTVIGAGMVLITAAISIVEARRLILARRAGRTLTEGEDDDDDERITSWRDAWVTLGALILYVVLFLPLGFIVTTLLFMFGISTYFARTKWLRNLIVTIVFTTLVYIVFNELLGVLLPTGILRGLI